MKKNIFLLLFILSCFIGFSQITDDANSYEAKQTLSEATVEFKIYPNPCKTDKVTIESSSDNITEISITNIAGKQVYLKKFIIPENKIQVELSEIPSGLYLVKIKEDSNKQIVKKLIVSKD